LRCFAAQHVYAYCQCAGIAILFGRRIVSIKLEQLFGVSHQSLCYCLRHLRLLTEDELQDHLAESMEIQQIATEYGYDLSLYQPGNEGVVIGDFGEKARLLFEQERISEGHYVELLNLLK